MTERAAAYLRAYDLFEAVQDEQAAAAAAELRELQDDAERRDWPEVAFVAAAALVVHAVVSDTPADVDALVRRAEQLGAPAFVALALGLRALASAGSGDAAALLTDAGRAVALLADPALPPLDRCTAYVVVAAAYNTLSLWELVDELYERAGRLVPLCPGRGQGPALAVNRVLIRLEWGTVLRELGEDEGARHQFARARAAVAEARDAELSPLWRQDVEAADTALRLLLGDAGPLDLAERQSAALHAAGDVEVVALLDAARALALLEQDRGDDARAVAATLAEAPSASSGARHFPAWARATVLAAGRRDEGAEAFAAYALTLARLRWEARSAVLVAARSALAMEQLRVDHGRLSLDLYLDPLTGLQNRRAFDEWLARPPAAAPAALLLLDLDGFKGVNDTYGHAAGDEVLRVVGRVMAEHLRPGDLALRPGGDEFAVVLEQDPPAPDVVLRRAEELAAAIAAAPWHDVAPGLAVRASIGIAVGPLEHGGGALYELADAALYAAKTERRVVLREVS